MTVVVFSIFLFPVGLPADPLLAPYPASSVIAGVRFDWSTHVSMAPGSGDWGTTWAADGHQYTAWGNGGGFGGSGSEGRVYLGVARVEGGPSAYRGVNVWGGKDAESEAQYGGKAYSLLSVDGTMYMWRCGATDGASAYDFQQLYRSTDLGRTWTFTRVEFTQASFSGDDPGFFCPVFLQFGRDYEGARDDYVYIYAPEIKSFTWPVIHVPGELTLIRVPKRHLADIDRYEYFAGFDAAQRPLWSTTSRDRRPVWEDALNGVMHPAIHYNASLGRYILIVEHTERSRGNVAIFDAPEPWGPWTTVMLESDFGDSRIPDNTFMWVIPTKWIRADGQRFVMIFSGKGTLDSWNTVEGRFMLE